MIRTGVFGSGNILENALEVFRADNQFLVTGIHNSRHEQTKGSTLRHFEDPLDLISVSEAIIITNNTSDFNEIIPKVLKNSRHLLIFPDPSYSFYQMELMIKLAEEADVIFYMHQDGIKEWMKELVHREYGRPEYIEAYSYIDRNRISGEGGIFKNLYSIISAVIKLNPVNPRKFYTNLVPYCSTDPLMANVRLEFENGTSANITINGFFERNDTKIEVFRNQCEIVIDPLSSEINIYSKNPVSSRIYKKPAGLRTDIYHEGLEAFAARLFSPELNHDPFDSGIITHRIATKIIHKFIPYPVRSA